MADLFFGTPLSQNKSAFFANAPLTPPLFSNKFYGNHMDIEFRFKSIHKFNLFGDIAPAMTKDSRLYVIMENVAKTVYVGTASNVQDRFESRSRAIRELSIPQTHLDNLVVLVVQILTNNKFTPPHSDGKVGTVDVEHLLTRTYTQHLHYAGNNYSKSGQFTNPLGGDINWRLTNPGNEIIGFGGPYNYTLNAGGVL